MNVPLSKSSSRHFKHLPRRSLCKIGDGFNSSLLRRCPSKKKVTDSGARLAALRKQAGLSKTALAEAVGIPQRTISFYEREAVAIPSKLVPTLAKVLGVSMEELLGIGDSSQRAKRGPKSQLERQLEAIATLPRHQQHKILAVVEAMIAHQR